MKNCRKKKFKSLLAIAAVAFTFTFSFSDAKASGDECTLSTSELAAYVKSARSAKNSNVKLDSSLTQLGIMLRANGGFPQCSCFAPDNNPANNNKCAKSDTTVNCQKSSGQQCKLECKKEVADCVDPANCNDSTIPCCARKWKYPGTAGCTQP